MATWRELLIEVLEERNEQFSDITAITLSDLELDKESDDGYGTTKGVPFTAWTANYVYFPARYDGSEWVASVPRNPSEEKTLHVGGG